MAQESLPPQVGALIVGAGPMVGSANSTPLPTGLQSQPAQWGTLLPGTATQVLTVQANGTLGWSAGGGGGSPGGSSGQSQYNNAGSFGGYTMSGDATLVASTGVITVAATAITYAKMQNVTASRLIGNPTGAGAAPSEISLGTNLSFAGAVLNASGGGTPGGSSGQIQYDNSGSFGGFTMGGDATINTGTGSLTVASIGGKAVTLAGALTTSGAFATTLTTTATTNVTLPISGILLSTATPVTVAQGGTGLATLTAHSVLVGEGASNVAGVATGTAGRVLVDQGAGADPLFSSTGLVISTASRPITTDTLTASWTPNLGVTDWHQGTLTANCTCSTVTSPTVGQTFYFRAIQAASGGPYTLSFSFGTITWLTVGGTAPAMSTGASSVSVFAFVCTSSGNYDGYLLGPGAAIGAGTITYADIQNESASTILGNPTGSAAAPSEITLYPNMGFVGTTLRSGRPIAVLTTAGTAIANTVTETSIFTGATVLAGTSLTIPANTIQVGSKLRFSLYGTLSSTGTPTLKVEFFLGGVSLGNWTSASIGAVSSYWWAISPNVAAEVMCLSTGATGSVLGILGFNSGVTGINFGTGSSGTATAAPTAITINTTTGLLIDVQFKWSVANAANTIQLLGGAIYLD
jgi:hypothetical protein